jgi:uncharacterized coiled-coil DUF342 family protein
LNNGKDEDEIRLTKEIDDLKRELKQVHSEFLQFQAKSGAVKEEVLRANFEILLKRIKFIAFKIASLSNRRVR